MLFRSQGSCLQTDGGAGGHPKGIPGAEGRGLARGPLRVAPSPACPARSCMRQLPWPGALAAGRDSTTLTASKPHAPQRLLPRPSQETRLGWGCRGPRWWEAPHLPDQRHCPCSTGQDRGLEVSRWRRWPGAWPESGREQLVLCPRRRPSGWAGLQTARSSGAEA